MTYNDKYLQTTFDFTMKTIRQKLLKGNVLTNLNSWKGSVNLSRTLSSSSDKYSWTYKFWAYKWKNLQKIMSANLSLNLCLFIDKYSVSSSMRMIEFGTHKILPNTSWWKFFSMKVYDIKDKFHENLIKHVENSNLISVFLMFSESLFYGNHHRYRNGNTLRLNEKRNP